MSAHTLVGGNRTLTWDTNDRLTQTVDSATGVTGLSSHSFGIDSASNRLLMTGGLPIGGPMPGAGVYGYNADGTPATVGASNSCSGTANYVYAADGELQVSPGLTNLFDPWGERLQKQSAACSNGTGVTNFAYDLAGHLIGEYDASGNALEETVWLGDTPVAVFVNGVAYYTEPDHLGAPRAIVNAAGTPVWTWDGEAFGPVPPNQNPSGLGTFTYNLRFAGQYYDVETGWNHNGWREYDPQTGRYAQSDPIGLAGGLNTYNYVGGNPEANSDPYGLWPFPISPGITLQQAQGYAAQQARTQPIIWSSKPTIAVNVGFNGAYHYGPLGNSIEGGFAIDTDGMKCVYATQCATAGWGEMAALTGAVTASNGPLCTGVTPSAGGFGTLSDGLIGSVQVTVDKEGSVAAAAGSGGRAGLGGGAAGGTIGCVQYTLCPKWINK